MCVSECVRDSLGVISSGRVIALEQRLHEEPQCSHDTHQDEDPQEQTVYHHGYILPVFYYLEPNQQVELLRCADRSITYNKVYGQVSKPMCVRSSVSLTAAVAIKVLGHQMHIMFYFYLYCN